MTELRQKMIRAMELIYDSKVYRILRFFRFLYFANGTGRMMLVSYKLRYKIGNLDGCSNQG